MISRAAVTAGALVLLQPALQCTSYEEGVSITVSVIHYAGAADAPALADGEPRVITTDLGYRVTLTEAWVSIERVEAFPCGKLGVRSRRGLFAPSLAYAHDLSRSPTVADLDYVADLMTGDGVRVALDVLLPPPGLYCGAMVELGPLPAGEIHHHALVPGGEASDVVRRPPRATLFPYTPPGGGGAVEFELSSTEELKTGVTFDTPSGNAMAYELSADDPEAEIVVALDYAGWLDGVDFAQPDARGRLERVQSNLLGSIHSHATR